jgi:hypothetical protein
MTIEQIIMAWAGVVITVGGAIGVLVKLASPIVKKTRALLNALELFTKDWFGDEGDSVHPRKPGVLERLAAVEKELQHNGGTSMKDAMKRIETKVNKIDDRLKEGDERMSSIESRMAG